MIIDFTFDKQLAPCDSIDIRIGESVKKTSLHWVNSRTRRAKVPNVNETVWFIKKNDWCEGKDEIFFCIDITFQNAFSGEKLPYSFEIPVNANQEKGEIDVLKDGNIHSDLISQKRWTIAVWIQFVIVLLLIAVPTVTFALLFNEYWLLITAFGILLSTSLLFLVRKRVKTILNLINGGKQEH